MLAKNSKYAILTRTEVVATVTAAARTRIRLTLIPSEIGLHPSRQSHHPIDPALSLTRRNSSLRSLQNLTARSPRQRMECAFVPDAGLAMFRTLLLVGRSFAPYRTYCRQSRRGPKLVID